MLHGGNILDTNGFNATIAGNVVNGGELHKIGAGTLTLAETSTATHAATRIYDGTFDGNGTHSAPLEVIGGTLTGTGSRKAIDAGEDAELRDQAFGARITFDMPGVAERAMYFGTDPLYLGGHASAGATRTASDWFLAEGATGSYFTTFVLIANPNDGPADVTLRYLPDAGAEVTKTYRIEAGQRITRNIALEDSSLANVAVATHVQSVNPVVVERAQYWGQPAWIEAHNSFGVTAVAPRWGLAEGRVGGADASQTYILLANAGAETASVTITFLRADGTTVVKTYDVAAASRFNVAVVPAPAAWCRSWPTKRSARA